MSEDRHAAEQPYLSLVIPAYNEGSRLGETLRVVTTYLRRQSYSWEVLVVDDGSTDGTRVLAETFINTTNGATLRVIANQHRGKAYAVRSGVLAAHGKIVGFTDADLATPIETLAASIDLFATGADVVIGSREGVGASRRDEPPYRHLMGRIFNSLVQIVALPGIQDTQCGFKIMRGAVARSLFTAMRLYGEASRAPTGPAVTGFDIELLFLARRCGYRIAEVPVTWQYIAESKVNPLRDTVRNVRDLVMVRINSLLGLYR